LTGDIVESASVAAQASYKEYGDILSFKGKLTDTVGFNFVSVAPAQLEAMVLETPVGGRLLTDWVGRTFESAIVEGMDTSILTGYLKGEGIEKIVNRLTGAFDIIKRDAESLTRTYIADANNRAAKSVYDANSDIIDAEEWNATLEFNSKPGRGTCLRCAGMSGKIFKLNEPHVRPPLHPNCVTAESIIFAPDVTHFMETKYSGAVIKLTLSDATVVTVTPNHMLMTPDGLVMARCLTNTDNLLCGSNLKGVVFGDPNDDGNNLRIDNIVKSFSKTSGVAITSMPMAPEYFHGDGIFGNKDIDIIDANSFLKNGINTKFVEMFSNKAFSSVSFTSFLDAYSAVTSFFERYLVATPSRIGLSREFFSFVQRCRSESDFIGFTSASGLESILFEKFDNWRAACSELLGDFEDGKFVIEEFDNFFRVKPQVLGVDRGTEREPSFKKSVFDCSAGSNVHEWGYLGEMPTAHVEPVKIINVSVVHVENLSVYDVTTLSSMYTVNGVLSSNCRCFMTPVTKSYRELGLNIDELKDAARPYTTRDGKKILKAGQFDGNFEDFFNSKGVTFQKGLVGPNRLRLMKEGKIEFSDLVDDAGDIRLLRKGKDGGYVGIEK